MPNLRTVCLALEHFSLPAALCSVSDNALVNWNRTFQKTTGLSDVELAQKSLSSLILLDESYGGLVLQEHDPEKVVRFVPCVLKKALPNEWVPGRALKRNDGMLLAMLSLPVDDVAFEGFIHGHLIGREEENNRTREFFHDVLSSKILVASFIAHEAYQTLAATGAQEAKQFARVSELLREVIEDVVRRFEGPEIQAKHIPESESASSDCLSSGLGIGPIADGAEGEMSYMIKIPGSRSAFLMIRKHCRNSNANSISRYGREAHRPGRLEREAEATGEQP